MYELVGQHICTKKLIDRNYRANHAGQCKYFLPLVIIEMQENTSFEVSSDGSVRVVSPLQPPLKVKTENHVFSGVPICDLDIHRFLHPKTA